MSQVLLEVLNSAQRVPPFAVSAAVVEGLKDPLCSPPEIAQLNGLTMLGWTTQLVSAFNLQTVLNVAFRFFVFRLLLGSISEVSWKLTFPIALLKLGAGLQKDSRVKREMIHQAFYMLAVSLGETFLFRYATLRTFFTLHFALYGQIPSSLWMEYQPESEHSNPSDSSLAGIIARGVADIACPPAALQQQPSANATQ